MDEEQTYKEYLEMEDSNEMEETMASDDIESGKEARDNAWIKEMVESHLAHYKYLDNLIATMHLIGRALDSDPYGRMVGEARSVARESTSNVIGGLAEKQRRVLSHIMMLGYLTPETTEIAKKLAYTRYLNDASSIGWVLHPEQEFYVSGFEEEEAREILRKKAVWDPMIAFLAIQDAVMNGRFVSNGEDAIRELGKIRKVVGDFTDIYKKRYEVEGNE